MSKPPVEIPLGAMRFNSDSQKLEYFNGEIWMQIHTVPNSPIAARGFFQGGAISTSGGNHIEYVTIATTGDAVDFGDLPTAETGGGAAGASFTRAVHGGGALTSAPWAPKNHISSWIMATAGNGVDWGDLTRDSYRIGAGNAGDNTRVCFVGGINPGKVDTIDYVTIESSGGAIDFGNLTVGRSACAGLSNSTRFFVGGGLISPTYSNTIDYVTTASLGNAIDWGDLTRVYSNLCGANSTVRGLFGGGYTSVPSGTSLDIISYIDLTSRGDAHNFGDLSGTTTNTRAVSNCHGGLG